MPTNQTSTRRSRTAEQNGDNASGELTGTNASASEDLDAQQRVPTAKPRSPAETIEFLKSATVFVKVQTSEGEQSGSGFLVDRDDKRGFVVTNSHVVQALKGTVRSISCVFRSGRPDEFSVKGAVVGRDEGGDLAILTVNHDELPGPLHEANTNDVHETLSVIVLGFPFGEVLTTSNRNPAITVTRCAISSIRRDHYDNVAFLQVNGGINPGNSGGPVVTEDGKLVSVAVAKLLGSEIGLAIPQRDLELALKGRIVRVEVKQITKDSRSRIFNVKPQILAATSPILWGHIRSPEKAYTREGSTSWSRT